MQPREASPSNTSQMPSLQAEAQALANRYLPSAADETFTQVRRHLARGGRPTTLTEDTIDALGDTIAETAEYIEDACLAYGIPRRNYYNWLKQGERDDDAGIESLQARFWRTLKAAESQGLIRLGKLWVANPRDFAAYATRKERKAPGKWARREDTYDGPRIQVNIGVASGEVKVGVAVGLSPSLNEDLHSLTPSVNSVHGLIRRNYVNEESAPIEVGERQIPAAESTRGPYPPAVAAGGQRTGSRVKGRSVSRKEKRAVSRGMASEGA